MGRSPCGTVIIGEEDMHHIYHLSTFARMAMIALLAVSGVFFVCVSESSASDPVAIDEAHFPDDGFRTYVAQNFDTDGDTYLSDASMLTAPS